MKRFVPVPIAVVVGALVLLSVIFSGDRATHGQAPVDIPIDQIWDAWIAIDTSCPSLPTPPGGTTVVGIDTDPSGNTATSLGPIQQCISVESVETGSGVPGPVFQIDIFVDEIPPGYGIWGVHYGLRIGIAPPGFLMTAEDNLQLLAVVPGSFIWDYSTHPPRYIFEFNAPPNYYDSPYEGDFWDLGDPRDPDPNHNPEANAEWGPISGVLGRYTLDVTEVPPGVYHAYLGFGGNVYPEVSLGGFGPPTPTPETPTPPTPEPPTPVPPTPVPTEIDYFALGDSVASGHGLMDTGPRDGCRQSDQAYPQKVLQELQSRWDKVNFHFFACSGATAGIPAKGDVKKYPHKYFHNQVNDVIAQLTERPTLVSITIGANDFEWGEGWNFLKRLYWNRDDSFRKWVDATAFTVQKSLEAEVSRLLQHPNVVVVVTEYHNPFNHSSYFFKGGPGNRCGLVDCYSRTEYGIHALNFTVTDTFVALGRPARMEMATLHAAFHDHESPRTSCGDDPPDVADTWVQYADDPNSNSYPAFPSWFPKDFIGDCFHPNDAGAQKYADAVNEDALRSGR